MIFKKIKIALVSKWRSIDSFETLKFISKYVFYFVLVFAFITMISLFLVGGKIFYDSVCITLMSPGKEEPLKQMFQDCVKGIEFIFLAPVPYLLILSIRRYFLATFPIKTPSANRKNLSVLELKGEIEKQNHLNIALSNKARIARGELLFVKSLIVSIFIALLITLLIGNLFSGTNDDNCNLTTSVISIVLIVILIIYYNQIEKAIREHHISQESIKNKE